MRDKTSISELKSRAKDALLGNYATAIGSFVLLFAFVYAIMSLLFSGAMSMAFAGRSGVEGISQQQLDALLNNDRTAMLLNGLIYIVMAVATPLIAIVATGYMYICREISYGRSAGVKDLFFCIKNHPDKVIIIALILYGIQVITQIPLMVYENSLNLGDLEGQQFLTYILIFVCMTIIRMIITIALSQCYLIYLDNTEAPVSFLIKGSLRMMKGNMWRYFYMMLTFIGYYVLCVLSAGLALLWVGPYQEVATIEFYKDIKEMSSIDYRI